MYTCSLSEFCLPQINAQANVFPKYSPDSTVHSHPKCIYCVIKGDRNYQTKTLYCQERQEEKTNFLPKDTIAIKMLLLKTNNNDRKMFTIMKY